MAEEDKRARNKWEVMNCFASRFAPFEAESNPPNLFFPCSRPKNCLHPNLIKPCGAGNPECWFLLLKRSPSRAPSLVLCSFPPSSSSACLASISSKAATIQKCKLNRGLTTAPTISKRALLPPILLMRSVALHSQRLITPSSRKQPLL